MVIVNSVPGTAFDRMAELTKTETKLEGWCQRCIMGRPYKDRRLRAGFD